MLRNGSVGHIRQILLQLRSDLPLRGRIERTIELPQRVGRGREDQPIELVPRARLVQRPCDLVDEFPLVGPVQVLTRLRRCRMRARPPSVTTYQVLR